MSINNKKAYYEYSILEEYVAGLKLLGSEVKALREGNGNINDTYVLIMDDEVYVRGMYIAKHKESSWMNHEEVRDRKLLLTKKQINDLKKILPKFKTLPFINWVFNLKKKKKIFLFQKV